MLNLREDANLVVGLRGEVVVPSIMTDGKEIVLVPLLVTMMTTGSKVIGVTLGAAS